VALWNGAAIADGKYRRMELRALVDRDHGFGSIAISVLVKMITGPPRTIDPQLPVAIGSIG